MANSLFCPPAEFQLPVTEPDINNRLESLCLSMTEHALGGECSQNPVCRGGLCRPPVAEAEEQGTACSPEGHIPQPLRPAPLHFWEVSWGPGGRHYTPSPQCLPLKAQPRSICPSSSPRPGARGGRDPEPASSENTPHGTGHFPARPWSPSAGQEQPSLL